ncbi:SMI1/KNR4 family protein [Micromonospora sp. NPDC049051]|uniref:SMI1/KNR4 family protein n=1 Tax=Micromonospora sp. NPDC049051 TaxID=3364264 RepID=UPI00371A32BF
MHPLIARLDRWLQANRPTYHASLQPGASSDVIDEIARRAGGELPALLRELLTWRDGQPDDSDDHLEHLWSLMSARTILDTLDDMAWLVENDDFAGLWGDGWVPFLGNIYGDHLCVDTAGGPGGAPGQIIEFKAEDHHRYIRYPSLEAWLETLVSAFEAGLSGDDSNPDDREAYEAFVARRHPGYPIARAMT